MNWKSKFTRKPSDRKKVFSRTLNKWLDADEEEAVLNMLKENRDKLLAAIKEQEPALSDEELNTKVGSLIKDAHVQHSNEEKT